jgi:hypothetical protein
MSEEPNLGDVAYRWHQIMFRLDEMDEMVTIGLTEDEADSIDEERLALVEELKRVEARLGAASVERLRSGHENDRAYARQKRQMDEEAGSS